MIERFIGILQIKLNLDKDGLIFSDKKTKSSFKNKESVFKMDNFIVLSENHSHSLKSEISPIFSFNLDNPEESNRFTRIRRHRSALDNSKNIIFNKNNYIVSNGFNMIIENIEFLNEEGYLIVCCNENDLSEENNSLLKDWLTKKGFSINAIIGIPPYKSRFRPRESIYIISKSHKNLFIADILEDGSNSKSIIDSFIKKSPAKKINKKQGDISSGYFSKRIDFISLYHERSKSKIAKITAFDEGFNTCALWEILNSVSSDKTSSQFLKTGSLDNSLFIKNIDSPNDNFNNIHTEEKWVESIATLGPLEEDYDHHKYFYISIDKTKIKAEYLVIFLRSHLGRELYKLAPKSKTRATNIHGGVMVTRMTQEDLNQLQIYYPDLKTQDDIIEADLKINKLQESLNGFHEALSTNPNKLIGESSEQILNLLDIVGKLNNAERIRNHIQKIETGYCEFKETWRFPVDLEGNKIKDNFQKRAEKMTPDIFKVINSFLNAYGGDLMIGISDGSHEPRGIEKEIAHYWGYDKEKHWACIEKFENEFKKTLYSCIDKKFIGDEKNIFWEFVPYEGKTVFMIRCRQSSSRCYLKHDSNIHNLLEHSFYHRVGNDSEPMDSDEERDKFWAERVKKPNQV